jgi:hypothetical protein
VYFERNAERMRYPAFRHMGRFVGSGVVEAACKTVIAQRLKQSGMFWTVRGANATIALRAAASRTASTTSGIPAPLDWHFYVAHPNRGWPFLDHL